MSATRVYTKGVRAAAEERTRTALLDAAQAAFFSRPLDRITLESVARDAGVTKQTLLRHFGTKDGLVEAAFARGFEEVRAQRMAAPSGDLGGALDNLLDHYGDRGELALKLASMEGLTPDLVRRARGLHHDWVDHAFGPWLRAARGKGRERLRRALVVLCDVQAWAILARDLGLPRAEVRATLMLAVGRLLEEEA